MSLIDILSFLLGVLLCGIALYLVWYVLRFLIVWAGAHFVLSALVVMMLLIIYGVIGDDLGLSNLFLPQIVITAVPVEATALQVIQVSWTEGGHTQFWSAVALMVLFLLISLIVHLLDRGQIADTAKDLVDEKRRQYKVDQLNEKRLQFTLPHQSAISDWNSLCEGFRRVFYAAPRPPKSPEPAAQPDITGPAAPPNNAACVAPPNNAASDIQRTVIDLLWRPCLFLAALSALPAFRNIWGWRSFFAETQWWWLVGLAFGLLLTLVGVLILTKRFRFLNPITDSDETEAVARWHRKILLLLWFTLSVLLGAALGLRNAPVLCTGQALVNGAEPTPSGFAQGFLVLGGLIGLTMWVRDRNREAPHPRSLTHRLVCGIGLGLLGYLIFWMSYRWFLNPTTPYLVSVLLCTLVGLIATIYPVFLTVPPTWRLAIILSFLAILFVANGTNWIHPTIGPADDYKLQFGCMNRDTPGGNRLASYYDYPVHLDSKSYLDRTYLKPASILNAGNTDPIVITSAYAHRLRTGDRVRITGVRGNPAANGTFAVLVDPKYGPNQFALAGTQGCGTYTFGGEWSVELDQGRIIDVRQDPEDKGLTTIISYDHGLKDGDEIYLVRADGEPFPTQALANPRDPQPPSKVTTRPRDDARSASQFLVSGTKQYAELRNGRWYRNPSKQEQGPRQGGVAWVTNDPPTWTQRAGAIVITTSDPAFPPKGTQVTSDDGVENGDHVLVEEVVANPEANGIWTVHKIDQNHFELLDPKHYEARHEPSSTEFKEFPPSFPQPASWVHSDWMSGGAWRVVTDRGRILDATNDKDLPIRIYSLSHGLMNGDHVEITGVRGNTRANGLWTVKTDDGDPKDPKDWFKLAGPEPAELDPNRPVSSNPPLPHRAEGGPKFDYRGNGQWRRVPDRGRLFAIRTRTSKLEFYSPDHHLRAGIVVEMNGLIEAAEDSQSASQSVRRSINGRLFRVEPVKKSANESENDPNWFSLEGVDASSSNLGATGVTRISNPAATWSVVNNRGPVWDVERKSPHVLVHSPAHGLQEGDHVRFSGSGPKLEGLSGLYSVCRANDPGSFEIDGSSAAASANIGPNLASREPMTTPIGRWERVAESGPIQPAGNSNAGPAQGPITVLAPKHGLAQDTWVTEVLTGPEWAERLAFSVDFGGAGRPASPDSFHLAGTESLKLGNAAGQPRLATSWRRLASQAELLRSQSWLVASKVCVVPHPKSEEAKAISITSPGHGLKQGDRIRLMRIGLKSDGTPALGEQYTDTFAVSTDGNGKSFEIPVYRSWSKYQKHSGPKSSIALLEQPAGAKGQAILCAWRPILDRGVIQHLERRDFFFAHPQYGKIDTNKVVREEPFNKLKESEQANYEPAARLRVTSPNHGLAGGAWVFVLGYQELGPGPFRIVDTNSDWFEIEVIGGSIPKSIKDNDMARWKVVDLLDDQEVLANWSDLQQSVESERIIAEDKLKGAGPPAKPKLAIVTVSGGGIRSAVWTATVLSRLEKNLPDLPYKTRLVTGASGGMVGAALYVATLQPLQTAPQNPADAPAAAGAVRGLHGPFFSTDPQSRSNPIVDALAQDQLTRVASQLVLSDLPSMLWPKPWGTDRGQALEWTWWSRTACRNENSQLKLPRRSPFALPLRSLAVGEWEGWRPSLIFTPMLVEDGRRILISNLNLDFAPRNVGHVLFARGTDKLSRTTKIAIPKFQGPVGDFDIYSLSAVEFFRVFPGANDFRLSTAARMSAAFPLITPAVSLPTVPPRRVVDAGYYDNFGVNLASLWVFQNRDWLFDYTSGVVLIQVRDSQSERSRRELEDPDPDPSDSLIARLCRLHPFLSWVVDCVYNVEAKARRGAQWLTSPIEGLSTARQANMSFRNDEQVEVLSDVINNWPDSPVRGRGFFTTVVFECPKEASLNWAITKQERRDIEQGFEPDQIDPAYSEGARRNAERLRILVNWWNR